MMKTLLLSTLTFLVFCSVEAQDYDMESMNEGSSILEEVLPNIRWESTSVVLINKENPKGAIIQGINTLKALGLYRSYTFNEDWTMISSDPWGRYTSWGITDGSAIEMNGPDGFLGASFWEVTDPAKLVVEFFNYDTRETLRATLEPKN